MADIEAYAAAVAPEIDRIRIAIARAIPPRAGALIADLGLPPPALQMLGMLRNLAPSRTATRDAIDEVFVYQPAVSTAELLDALAGAGFVTLSGDAIALTARGVEAVDGLYAITDAVVTEMWGATGHDFPALYAISSKVMKAASDSGGAAYRVMFPMYAPDSVAPATVFAESLTPLRFHRFDAHIAAWRAAGVTAEQAQALEDGQLKETIEADTNARAALAYATLTDAERGTLLDALRTLPIVES